MFSNATGRQPRRRGSEREVNPTALWRRTFITACMLTRTTELAARQLGVSFFLPALFVRRYAEMGGLDQAVFTRQRG